MRFVNAGKFAALGLIAVMVAVMSSGSTGLSAQGNHLNSTPLSSVDLSNYVRVGRFDLPEPTRTVPPANSKLAQEASGVTYNWDTDTLFVVGDGGTSVVQVSKTGQLINSMTLAPGGSPQGTEFYDTEGITYVGGGKFVMVEERDRRAVLFTYVAGTTLTRAAVKTVTLGTFAPNIGIEGISYDPQTGGFIAVKETSPQGIFQTGIDFNAGTATNGSATTENSINLFDPALAGLADFADVFALSNLASLTGPDADNLLVLSQESGKIVNIDRSGTISSSLTIFRDFGNPLSVADHQHEGLTMDGDGKLYVVNENGGGDSDHPQLWVYAPSSAPNLAPTNLVLSNQLNTIVENTSTAARIKVADVFIFDDGLGVNNLSVTGADSSFFEVDLNGLYLKAGTVLDFETKTSYTVTVAVDDVTVGTTPDATAIYTLAVGNLLNETPGLSTVFISEVYSAGNDNGTYAADWFEVTNPGASAVNIAGWQMDDNSNGVGMGVKVALRGVTSIPAGKSAIFFEGNATGTTDAAIIANFSTAWFGSATPPAGFLIGAYGGSGVGLSAGSGDAVNLFDAGGARITGVSFGAATTGFTFDNTAGFGSATLPLPTISTLSAVGVNRAFLSANGAEVGSPGAVAVSVIISEVAAWGNGNTRYDADWFELTNTGANAMDITGWQMDDNSNGTVMGVSAKVALRGVTSIPAGKSAIFFEGNATGTTDAAIRDAFLTEWFGSTTPPAGFLIGAYGGGGVGLSTGTDAVNIFDAGGARITGVSFGGSTTFRTFDNAAGLGSTTLPLPTISTLSVRGVHGAFLASNPLVSSTQEVGSPGTNAARVIISEVSPWSSSSSLYEADWFEVTNTGTLPVDITGWKMDDESNSSVLAVALRGLTSIPAGKSAVFIEGDATGSTDAALIANFSTAWTGSVTPPAGFPIGAYGGVGVGLSSEPDVVNLFDSVGNRITGVNVVASTNFFTFDNAAGLGGTTLPLPTASTLSIAGVNGAFLAADGLETGSPWKVAGGSNDEDIDGVTNDVDPSPLDASNQTFSDAVLGGSTTGTILARNGKTITITDATPNPGTGVQIVVSGAGSGRVLIQLDGKAEVISLPNGTYVLTDPSNTSTVKVTAGGPAQITVILNGLPLVIVLGNGASLTYIETPGANGTLTELDLDAVEGNVTVNGIAVTAPVPLAGVLDALGQAKFWVGLKNSDDVGTRFDLSAEVLIGPTKIGSGQLNNVAGGSSGFNNALLNSLTLNLTHGAILIAPDSTLTLQVSVRRTCIGTGHASGTARLWYGGQPIDSGVQRDSGSRFGATVNGLLGDDFLRGASTLSHTPGSSKLFADIAVDSKVACPDRPFKSFGAWTIALP